MADNGYPVPVVENDGCRVFQIHDETGEGTMTQYDLFPGVCMMYNDFHMESCDSEFYTTEDLLCIDYCRQGRMEYPAGPDGLFCPRRPDPWRSGCGSSLWILGDSRRNFAPDAIPR